VSCLRALQSGIHRWLALYQHALGLMYRYFGSTTGLRSEYAAATERFTRAIDLNPLFARAYLDRGILYWRELDQPRRAIADLTMALDLDPALSEARFNRGLAHQQLHEYAEAVADFQAYLATGEHPYWREFAESMLKELNEWIPSTPAIP